MQEDEYVSGLVMYYKIFQSSVALDLLHEIFLIDSYHRVHVIEA